MKALAGALATMGLLSCGGAAAADESWRDEGMQALAPVGDELTSMQRAAIWWMLDAETARLALSKAGVRPSFRWPLRAVRGYSDPKFWRISNHVDHDATFPNHVRDFSCGGRTYDRSDGYNHQGTDIALAPDGWNLMAAGQIEIVAAAPGTIIAKTDGNFDRSCAQAVGSEWNSVYVQHDDGSIAWYGHMKNASPTGKGVGERVVAGEYLGLVGSSGNSTGPHLHFEVYDSQRRLIDPFAGACNLKNSESWWESQPPYSVTEVFAVTPASAAPVASTCGTDGRLVDPGTFNRKTAFAIGDTVWFVASLRELPVGSRVHYEVRDPTGALWSQFDNSAATELFLGSNWWASFRLAATAPVGTWMVEASVGSSRAQAPFTVSANGAPVPNYTDLWWNPAESGWGINLSHQGSTLFATWFTYDSDGTGLWLVMPSGALQSDGSFTGTLYRTTGVPFDRIRGAPASNPDPANVGSARVRFTDVDHATFSYTVNGVSQQKSLERQRFGTAPTCIQMRGARDHASNYQDLWWNSSESGWGINLTHQGDTVFATWFTYGAGGRGMWLVAPDARRQATGEFRGRLYRTNGVAFDRIAGAPATTGTPLDVGELSLSFTDGEHGRLDYVVDGVAQTKAIERQVFAAGAPLCR
jgi:murein DD-endopeptidase MepM/ murein hydrolase activator NlpD